MQLRADDPPPATATASDADWSAWASVPWTPVPWTHVPAPEPSTDSLTSTTTSPFMANPPPIGFHKPTIPYLPPSSALPLQTLSVWIPNPSQLPSPPPSSLLPLPPLTTWIICIHGGAWRDPAITASSFTATATDLLLRSSTTPNSPPLAGMVSIDYRLSPHPNHPSSSPSHKARHPDHIADVLDALTFLHRVGIIPHATNPRHEWILAGHSCGASLGFQVLMSPARWGLDPGSFSFPRQPAKVVGVNGLYDLAGFIEHPPTGYEDLREGYREFVAGAFGEDEKVWREVSPATVEGGWVRGEWLGGGGSGEVVLVRSDGDGLVPAEQGGAMKRVLEGEGVTVTGMGVEGGHDAVWEVGERLGGALWRVMGGRVD
ncbi:hypothetical protein C8A05DRAFT_32617 [Staphylotrichum tortipilum]|uniref:Kynurenine formamidase n=1 Tax=Staphylotrichum tortipilum TaxID=2831512 RepID=A0AAN6RUM3_9PEZI|nr:hypothetical protein C8A05DRAFT_32617 [Staphylotrichum longicolle]